VEKSQLEKDISKVISLWLYFTFLRIDIPEDNIDSSGFIQLLESMGYKIILKENK